jgi:dTMP kinase
MSKVIMPALNSGSIVICDRFFDSTVVYQGIARKLGKEQILNMSLWACSNVVPDLTFLLSIKVDKSEERMKITNREKDRIEAEKDLFKEKICKGYLEIAEENKDRFIVLDGGKDIQSIFGEIKNNVERVLKEKRLI